MNTNSKFTVVVRFPDGSTKEHRCVSKGEAKRKFVQALQNPVTQRTGAVVTCLDEASGEEVSFV